MQMTSLVRANFLILNSRSGTNLVSDRYYRLEIVTLAFLLIYIALQVATYPLFVSSSWCYSTIKLQLQQKSDCKYIYVDYRNRFRKVVNLGELQQLDYGLLRFHEIFKDAKIYKMHTIIVLTKKSEIYLLYIDSKIDRYLWYEIIHLYASYMNTCRL